MKRRLEVQPLMDDIKRGLTDEEIMSKYEISKETLPKIFEKLIRAIAAAGSSIEIDE